MLTLKSNTFSYGMNINSRTDVTIYTVVKELSWKCFVKFRLCQLGMIDIQVTTKKWVLWSHSIIVSWKVISRLFLFVLTYMFLWLTSSITQIWIKLWT